MNYFNESRGAVVEKIKESASSVLPIFVIVLLMCLFIVPIQTDLVLCFVLGAVMGGSLHVQSALAVVVMLYLAFICGAGYVLWALLMKNNPVSRIAIFGFVNPVVNVLLSAVLNGEPLFRWQYLAALVFVCVGIWLVNKAPAKKEGK